MRKSFFMITLMFVVALPGALSQNLEVEGKAKITEMELDNSADSVVVVLPDGTLGRRDVSTLTEFQVLSISNDTIYLTNGGFVKLPPDNVDDADADASNEIQTLNISRDTIYLTGGGFVKLPQFFLKSSSDSIAKAGINQIFPPTILDTINLNAEGMINDSSFIKVCVNISHDYLDDIDMSLISPNSDTIDLSSDNGGTESNYTNTCFVSDAIAPITSGTAPFTGEYLPEGNFSDLNGTPISGVWVLMLEDDVPAFDHGTLNMWSLEIEAKVKANDLNDADADPLNEIQNLETVLHESNDAGDTTIINLRNPVNAQDAATKAYVDLLETTVDALETVVDSLETEIVYLQGIKDIDNNRYEIVTIGTQTWMAENLKTTRYNDGTVIPLITDGTAWSTASTNGDPGYCWYENISSNLITYGALYNWYAIDTLSNGGKNVCPTGWHAPTDAEWTILTTYLGGSGVAGGKMKEAGLAHWNSPNTGGTNESGFAGLPGGNRFQNGTFIYIGSSGYWWSSTESFSTNAWFRLLYYFNDNLLRDDFGNKGSGFSVRCLRDN